MTTRVELTTRADGSEVDELWAVYDAVFGDQPDESAWRANVWDRHSAREGFRLARAYDGPRLVGFGYGYTGQRGQWWTDQVSAIWPPSLAAAWLGGHFELVSIGVCADARGRGLGRELIRTLTRDLPHERWLLQAAADPAEPARRLYESEGWQVVGPGLSEDRVVLGRRRPQRRASESRPVGASDA